MRHNRSGWKRMRPLSSPVGRPDSAPRGRYRAENGRADWTSLSDNELLERRISKLGLRLEGTALEPLIRQFYEELSAKREAFPAYKLDWINQSSLSGL